MNEIRDCFPVGSFFSVDELGLIHPNCHKLLDGLETFEQRSFIQVSFGHFHLIVADTGGQLFSEMDDFPPHGGSGGVFFSPLTCAVNHLSEEPFVLHAKTLVNEAEKPLGHLSRESFDQEQILSP